MDDRRQSPRPGTPVERVRGEHPSDESWRADAFAPSRHSDLRDEISPPLDVHDPETAEAVCAEICRNALGGLAAGLVLLPASLRRRAQAVSACAVTLLDFARQTGLEGEKLALINRWEFELERSLEGAPAGQPVFVQVARLHAESPLPPQLLDDLVAAARRRVAVRRPRDEVRFEAECRELGRLALSALGVEAPTEGGTELAGLLVRARRLLAFEEDLRRHQVRLPPVSGTRGAGPEPEVDAEEAARRAAARERELLGARLDGAAPLVAELPPKLRPAGRFALGAARRLLGRFEPRRPLPAPELGLWERVRLLLVSRWA